MQLKPKNLGVANKRLPAVGARSVNKTVESTLSEAKSVSEDLRHYCLLLLKYFSHHEDKKIRREIEEFWKENRGALTPFLSDIKNNFGEILGGISISQSDLMRKFYPGSSFAKSELLYPANDREPLMDYAVFADGQEFIISAKVAGAVSNTVKPQDLVALIDKSPHIPKSHKAELKRTLEYGVLKTLQTYDTKVGPGAALSYIVEHGDAATRRKMMTLFPIDYFPSSSRYFSEFKDMDRKVGERYNGTYMERVIKSPQFRRYGATHNVQGKGRGIPNWGDLVLFFENILQKASKARALDFGEVFAHAIMNQVHYMKINLNLSTGVPTFEAYAKVKPAGGQTVSNIEKRGITLRSKGSRYANGKYKFKGKIGIQT